MKCSKELIQRECSRFQTMGSCNGCHYGVIADIECKKCNGTGIGHCDYTHPEGMTMCLKCKRCLLCNGTGKLKELTIV
jgi:hypothetical protein